MWASGLRGVVDEVAAIRPGKAARQLQIKNHELPRPAPKHNYSHRSKFKEFLNDLNCTRRGQAL
jgi:hypothetical protein